MSESYIRFTAYQDTTNPRLATNNAIGSFVKEHPHAEVENIRADAVDDPQETHNYEVTITGTQ